MRVRKRGPKEPDQPITAALLKKLMAETVFLGAKNRLLWPDCDTIAMAAGLYDGLRLSILDRMQIGERQGRPPSFGTRSGCRGSSLGGEKLLPNARSSLSHSPFLLMTRRRYGTAIECCSAYCKFSNL
jgi:hypothetical protein